MTQQTILVAGCGFAGLWGALAAARAVALAGRGEDVRVTMVAPEPRLGIRPRFHEAVLDDSAPDVAALLAAAGVEFVAGKVTAIDTPAAEATVALADGGETRLAFARLVLATGSTLDRGHVPGLAEHGFDVDTMAGARRLEAHLAALPARPGRDTVVVAGGGFTGLEVAAEMPERLRSALGEGRTPRVILVDPAAETGAGMGQEAAPIIRAALSALGVEMRPATRVTAIDADGATLSDGTRIDAATVIWTAGVRAHPLATGLPGPHDAAGRVMADAYLRAPETPSVFVTGDSVSAATDDEGNRSLMSCQHALSLGRVAGHNAAADLVGLPLHAYAQPKYVTCLDLGAWGALYTEGWERAVHLTGAEAKDLKRTINTVWIYPPAPDRAAAFAAADPATVIVP